jgi:hypothetical protein
MNYIVFEKAVTHGSVIRLRGYACVQALLSGCEWGQVPPSITS